MVAAVEFHMQFYPGCPWNCALQSFLKHSINEMFTWSLLLFAGPTGQVLLVPEDPNAVCIMVATGTGSAPDMALCSTATVECLPGPCFYLQAPQGRYKLIPEGPSAIFTTCLLQHSHKDTLNCPFICRPHRKGIVDARGPKCGLHHGCNWNWHCALQSFLEKAVHGGCAQLQVLWSQLAVHGCCQQRCQAVR